MKRLAVFLLFVVCFASRAVAFGFAPSTDPRGIVTTYSYDGADRLTGKITLDSAGGNIVSYQYAYYAANATTGTLYDLSQDTQSESGVQSSGHYAKRFLLWFKVSETLNAAPAAMDWLSSAKSKAMEKIGAAVERLKSLLGEESAADEVIGTKEGGKSLGAAKATLSQHMRKMAEAHINNSGTTVLGLYEPPPGYQGYLEKAGKEKAIDFDLGKAWRKLTPEERTATNNHFLDIIASRGDRVLLSVPKAEVEMRPGTTLAREIEYLKSHYNYKWVNQWSLQRKLL